MGHTACAPEGREGRSQAGPKGPLTSSKEYDLISFYYIEAAVKKFALQKKTLHALIKAENAPWDAFDEHNFVMFWWEDNQNKFNPKLLFNDIVGLNSKSSERGSHPCSNAVCDPRSNLCAYSVRRPSGGITSGLRATESPLGRLSLSPATELEFS